MLSLLALIPAFPLLGFAILFVTAGLLPKRWITTIGVGSVGISAILALIVMFAFLGAPKPYTEIVWTWIAVSGFTPHIGFYLDALSGLMMLVVAFVSFLIHLYSAEFMSADEGYSRYFAYMNLFVASMLVLVLADNLLFLYLGWEGVGLCSYLLIGFWYRDPANGLAARKAFIVTRVGDTAMAIGLFVLFTNLGTLDIQPLMQQAVAHWPVGSALPIAAAALLLGGALGKSAQLPLQTWLPDAMAGPTPVSALIHAATMVTAGVYLIARTHVLYDLAPPVHTAVAVIGALTLLLAGFSALNQTDLKRILAYSTISQIGYMFLALGVGAWSAAIFHFMTHAFFKALLFLSAGVVVQRLGEEHDIFKMGGLRQRLPLAFWSFLIGSISLAALPLDRRRLLQQGPHSMGSLVRRRFGSLVVGRRADRRLADGDLYLPRRLCRVLRSRQARTHRPDRLAHRCPAGRALDPRAGRRLRRNPALSRQRARLLPADAIRAAGPACGGHRGIEPRTHVIRNRRRGRHARRRDRLYRVPTAARLPGGAGSVAGEPCPAALLGNRLGIRLAVRPGAGPAVSLGCPDRPGRFHRSLLQRPGFAEPS